MTTSQDPPDWLAKDCFDVGLFTNQFEPMLEFWRDEIGLTFDHMLPVGGGVRQHRLDHQGSVLKLNHTRTPLPPTSAGGYRRLIVVKDDLSAPRDVVDPDGNHIQLVPKGHLGIGNWAIEVMAKDAEAFYSFYQSSLGLPLVSDQPFAVQCGRSRILGIEAPTLADQTNPSAMPGIGFRYLTLQVFKVDRQHASILSRGGREGAAPRTLGETARISFVKDLHGNWMELSQRASITGSLAPG